VDVTSGSQQKKKAAWLTVPEMMLYIEMLRTTSAITAHEKIDFMDKYNAEQRAAGRPLRTWDHLHKTYV
jgi:hypothetical protein